MIRITFLGTSHGVPEKDRFCSSTLIEIGDDRYLVDMGGPVTETLIRRDIPLETIKAVFITHPHGDHTNGLIGFADLLSWYFLKPDPLLLLPEQALADALSGWVKLVSGNDMRLRTKVVSEGVVYDDGVLRASAIATQHCRSSYAYMFEAEGKRLVFTGDLAGPDKDFPAVCFDTPCDLIVCEAAHFPTTAAADTFERARPGRVIINHINPALNLGNIEKLRAGAKSYRLDAAYDGMTVEL